MIILPGLSGMSGMMGRRRPVVINSVRSGLIAEYDPASITGVSDGSQFATAWPDSSGSGNNLAIDPFGGGVGFRPTWIADGYHGRPVVRYGGTAPSGDMPALSGDFTVIAMIANIVDTSNEQHLLQSSSLFDLTLTRFAHRGNWRTYAGGGEAVRLPDEEVYMWTVTRSGSTVKIYQGSVLVYSGTLTIGATALHFGSYNGDFTPYADFLYVCQYNRALSGGEVQSIARAAGRYFDNKTVLLVGNSHYTGTYQSAGSSVYNLLTAHLASVGKSRWSVVRNALDGRKGITMAAEATMSAPFSINRPASIASLIDDWHMPMVVFLTEMTNDGDSSDEDVAAHMVTVSQAFRSRGAKVFFHPEMSRSLLDPERTAAHNALVRAQASAFTGIMDIDLDAHLGAVGANEDRTYFLPDGVHLTDFGCTYMVDNYHWPTLQTAIA